MIENLNIWIQSLVIAIAITTIIEMIFVLIAIYKFDIRKKNSQK